MKINRLFVKLNRPFMKINSLFMKINAAFRKENEKKTAETLVKGKKVVSLWRFLIP